MAGKYPHVQPRQELILVDEVVEQHPVVAADPSLGSLTAWPFSAEALTAGLKPQNRFRSACSSPVGGGSSTEQVDGLSLVRVVRLSGTEKCHKEPFGSMQR